MSEIRTVNAWIIEKIRKYKGIYRWDISNQKDGKVITTVASKIEYLFEVGNQYKLPLETAKEGLSYSYIINRSFSAPKEVTKEEPKVPRRTAKSEKAKDKEYYNDPTPSLKDFEEEEVTDVDADIESFIEPKGTALLKVDEQSLDFIEQIDRDRIIQQFNDYQFVMKNIVDKNDWVNIKGKQHLKKSGFIKLAVAFQISVEIVETVDLSKGVKYKYRMTARATSQNGRSMEAVGMCSSEEYSDKRGEHVIFATCETRAKVRAISSLMGMGLVSADEMQ